MTLCAVRFSVYFLPNFPNFPASRAARAAQSSLAHSHAHNKARHGGTPQKKTQYNTNANLLYPPAFEDTGWVWYATRHDLLYTLNALFASPHTNRIHSIGMMTWSFLGVSFLSFQNVKNKSRPRRGDYSIIIDCCCSNNGTVKAYRGVGTRSSGLSATKTGVESSANGKGSQKNTTIY